MDFSLHTVETDDNTQLPADWRHGMSLSEDMTALLRSGLHSDVLFRCADQDQADTKDRLSAHKLILASRSPVFESMFYGQLEGTTEVNLPDAQKIPFLLFLRYLYSDTTDLSEETVLHVMKLAQKYQIKSCYKFCSKYLKVCLHANSSYFIDSIGRILEQARLFDDKELEAAAINFIDDNASAVIATEEFKDISQETLEYILKGDTFYAPEVDIIAAVDAWATKYLQKNKIPIDAANKRSALENAFHHLRLPAVSFEDLKAVKLSYGYLTEEEYNSIAVFIYDKTKADLSNSTEERIPRKVTYWLSGWDYTGPGPSYFSTHINSLKKQNVYLSVIHLSCKKDFQLEELVMTLEPCKIEKASGNISVYQGKRPGGQTSNLTPSGDNILKLDIPIVLKKTIGYSAYVSVKLPDERVPAFCHTDEKPEGTHQMSACGFSFKNCSTKVPEVFSFDKTPSSTDPQKAEGQCDEQRQSISLSVANQLPYSSNWACKPCSQTLVQT